MIHITLQKKYIGFLNHNINLIIVKIIFKALLVLNKCMLNNDI